MHRDPNDAKSVFLRALDIDSGPAREQFLAEACQADVEFRARVEELIHSFEQAGRFLEDKPAAAFANTVTPSPFPEQPGDTIGPYKLREVLGEGGMGIVFAAEQERPIRRTVAVKVIKPGMDTREVIARFEAERQALALMDHPNIARVIDGGTTGSGRPYFVMELVKGVPITEYCDQQRLATCDRLRLFDDVCHAVQHAHQKGIIHRDLKPTNVLVSQHDGKPLAKVIDFGIAKALGQQQLTDKTLFTGFAQLIGTPMYMSPEQAALSDADIDTRSDVYSLGVLLYELLTGQTPFDKEAFSKLGFDDVRWMIREVEPPRPSARICTLAATGGSTIARRRGIDERHFDRALRGELDWIVMKSMEKDRTRRYESASALATDVRRYLHNEPLEACPPSALYRMHKFCRRNKAIIITVALIVLALLAGTGVSVWQAAEATGARRLADQRLQRETEARRDAETQRDSAEIERLRAELNLWVALRGFKDQHIYDRPRLLDPRRYDMSGLSSAQKAATAAHFQSAIRDTRKRIATTDPRPPDKQRHSRFASGMELSVNHASYAIWLAQNGSHTEAIGQFADAVRVADSAYQQFRRSDFKESFERHFYVSIREGLNKAVFELLSTHGDDRAAVRFVRPLGMVVDPDGNLLVCSRNAKSVMRFDLKSGILRGTLALVPSAHGLAYGPNGNLFVSCDFTDGILELDAKTGQTVRVFVANIDSPVGLAFGPDKNLYVASHFAHSVRRFDGATGQFIDDFVPPRAGGLHSPAGLAFGRNGDLYVVSVKLNAVLRYSGLTGEFLGSFGSGGGLSWPVYLAFGPDGDLYVTGRDSDAVHRYSGTTGEFVGLIGGSELIMPEGLVFDQQGHLYVNSSATCRFYEYDAVSGVLLRVLNHDNSGATNVEVDEQTKADKLSGSAPE